ncbi:MAG: isochorismatase family protein, partial [Pseudomonadota bacterium]
MNDWQDSTREDYLNKGLASRSGYGSKPALLIVDFSNGFTDPKSPLGGNFDQQLATTASLLTEFRRGRLPVVYTTVAYQPDYRDAGVFIKKVPSLSILVEGSDLVQIDDRIAPQQGEHVIVKKYASSFFGTELDVYFRGM